MALAPGNAGEAHSADGDGDGHPVVLTGVQSDWQDFALTMKQAGFDV